MKEATLVILAAGMGSRYGGLKQLDGMGPNGETLLEYGVYDAIEAGFERILFIVREAFEEAFRERILKPIGERVQVETVCQETWKLPKAFARLADGREKPWGTGHALWCAAPKLNGAFGVINADDYYGRSALKTLRSYLRRTDAENWAGLVGYHLGKTLSENGTVSRGIIYQDKSGKLEKVRECAGLQKKNGEIVGELDGEQRSFASNQLVSMNCFGFGPEFLSLLDDSLSTFFNQPGDRKKGEFYLPEVLNRMTQTGGTVAVMDSDSEWMGVTYAEDKASVTANLQKMVDRGDYPAALWMPTME